MIQAIHATPKNLKTLFTDVKYKIPSYQRPYSWTEDECGQLWEDIVNFYEQTKNEENERPYFLGNIVCYRAENKRDLEVIDGQQRLTTIFLLLRALHDRAVNYVNLYSLFWETTYDIDSKPQTEHKVKLTTEVFGGKESESFQSVMSPENRPDENTRHAKNFNFFKTKVEDFYSEKPNEYQRFIDTILDKIVLLPIDCNDQEHALTVFETINNRGMNLADSDIFKAQLYGVAQKNKSEKDFIQRWDELTQNAESAKTNLDYIFRIYLRILRGRKGIKDREPGLRKFFTDSSQNSQDRFTLSEQNDWKGILDDLERICECGRYLEAGASAKITKWLKILQVANKLQSPIETPLYAYLFEHLSRDEEHHSSYYLIKEKEKEFETLCRAIVRFDIGKKLAGRGDIKHVYIQAVKTKNISEEILSGFNKLDSEDFKIIESRIQEGDFGSRLSQIRRAVVYILAYHEDGVQDQGEVEIEHILPQKWNHYQYNWTDEQVKEAKDCIGNLVLLEKSLNRKAGKAIFSQKKEEAYAHSKLKAAKDLCQIEEWTYDKFKEREKEVKGQLKKFFRNKTSKPS